MLLVICCSLLASFSWLFKRVDVNEKDKRERGKPPGGIRMTLAQQRKRELLRLNRRHRRSFSLMTTSCCSSRTRPWNCLDVFRSVENRHDVHLYSLRAWCSLQSHSHRVSRIPLLATSFRNHLPPTLACLICPASFMSSMLARRGQLQTRKLIRLENHTRSRGRGVRLARFAA